MKYIGAEATVTIHEDTVTKDRVAKTWRHKDIDIKIRRKRTRQEATILQKLPITPKLIDVDKTTIRMKRIRGEQLLNTLTKKAIEKVGKAVAIMHDADIYHGDLTTKNILITKDKAYIIDFGLGGGNARAEDKAVDLHILQTVIHSEKPTEQQELWQRFLQTYNPKQKQDILTTLKKVNKRGRYK